MLFAAAAALVKLDLIISFTGKVLSLLFPAAFGFVTAAILDEPMKKAEGLLKKIFPKISHRVCRCAAVTLIFLAIAGAAAVILAVVIPRLAESIKLFINSFDGYYRNFLNLAQKNSALKFIMESLDKSREYIRSVMPKIAEKAYDITSSAIASVTNLLLSAVISVYLLIDKEKFLLAASRVLTAFLGEEKMCRTVKFTGLITGCFSRFICGQLAEGLALGIMCFLGMIIFGFDYPLLISVLIAVTALIPVVGAFIGTIPSAIMLFLIEPSQAMWFIVFILVLQQIEGNLVYPKIVGRSVGLPPLIILIAILMGAGIGGIKGILLGVPAASALYLVIREKTTPRRSEIINN